jgi:hypothetical protein
MLKARDFIAYVKKYGVAKQNRFNIVLTVPDEVSKKIGITSASSTLSGISLMAQQVNIPGYNVAIQEAVHQNSTRKVIYDKSEGEFDITFVCSGSMFEKKLFDAWKKTIFREDHTVQYYDDYISEITVQQLNEQDQVVYETTITECYPSTVGQLSLDRSARDSVQTLNVVFYFRKVKGDDAEGLSTIAIPSIPSSQIDTQVNSATGYSSQHNVNDGTKFTTDYLNVLGDNLGEEAVKNIVKDTIRSLPSGSEIGSFLEGVI